MGASQTTNDCEGRIFKYGMEEVPSIEELEEDQIPEIEQAITNEEMSDKFKGKNLEEIKKKEQKKQTNWTTFTWWTITLTANWTKQLDTRGLITSYGLYYENLIKYLPHRFDSLCIYAKTYTIHHESIQKMKRLKVLCIDDILPFVAMPLVKLDIETLALAAFYSSVYENELQRTTPRWIMASPKLKRVVMRRVTITGETMKTLTEHPKMEEIILYDCVLSTVGDINGQRITRFECEHDKKPHGVAIIYQEHAKPEITIIRNVRNRKSGLRMYRLTDKQIRTPEHRGHQRKDHHPNQNTHRGIEPRTGNR